jgi:hypothetical protein
LGVVCLVDDLSHPDHLTLVVADGHGQYEVCPVASAKVYFAVEPGVLKIRVFIRIALYIVFIQIRNKEK